MPAAEPEYFIGLISGTSIDGIDAALVSFQDGAARLLHSLCFKYDESLQQTIRALCSPGENEIDRLGQTDVAVGIAFSDAALALLKEAGFESSRIAAIGSHGQTVRHHADWKLPFSLQIGDPNMIAERTGITTVADFRRRDIAAGGQGAPLAPAFHAAVFSSADRNRAILNLGGIANLTLLEAVQHKVPVLGFDTGPANVLLDLWSNRHLRQPHDENGQWAAGGTVDSELLKNMLTEPYFRLTPPKSTGRELFNSDWLEMQLTRVSDSRAPQDIAATLVELTATTVAEALKTYFQNCEELYICGGGARNSFLCGRLAQLLEGIAVDTTAKLGVDPDWVEAVAFAWLARQCITRQAGNLASVTGARSDRVLGGIYYS